MMLISPTDRFAIFGALGMAGSAISRALDCSGYHQQLKPSRKELTLDLLAVQKCSAELQPSVVVLLLRKLEAFMLTRLIHGFFLGPKIQTNIIETAWRSGGGPSFLGRLYLSKVRRAAISEEALLTGPLESTNEWYAIAKISGIKLCESLRSSMALMPSA